MKFEIGEKVLKGPTVSGVHIACTIRDFKRIGTCVYAMLTEDGTLNQSPFPYPAKCLTKRPAQLALQ